MSKPKVFLSSTCRDLAEVRDAVTSHFEGIGFEVLRSDDSTKFGVEPGDHSHDACLKELENANYYVLVIAGRFGGQYKDTNKSITQAEFEHARKLGIPIISFIRRDVEDARHRHSKKAEEDYLKIVDDLRLFDFIDVVRKQKEDNWTHSYEQVGDITSALTTQTAHHLLLFAKGVVAKKTTRQEIDSGVLPVAELTTDFSDLGELSRNKQVAESVRNCLTYIHSIIESICRSETKDKELKLKVLWTVARLHEGEDAPNWILADAARVEQYMPSRERVETVLKQLKDFGVEGLYERDDIPPYDLRVLLSIKGDENEASEGYNHALLFYVKRLGERHDKDDAYWHFSIGDMAVFTHQH